jgi:hypothetical protein
MVARARGWLATSRTALASRLNALPKVGSVKATKILHSCRVSPSKTFGGLSERQRAELAGHLTGAAPYVRALGNIRTKSHV